MNWFQRLKSGLAKSSSKINTNLKKAFIKKKLDKESLEKLEDGLLQADIGIESTQYLIRNIKNKKFDNLINENDIKNILSQEIENILNPVAKKMNIPKLKNKSLPFVILIVGVNGSGKTTTIGKLSSFWKNKGYKIRLAACDTFRAAAVEQLLNWGKKSQVPVVIGKENSDPASLAYDALKQAKELKDDLLIIDTAGRLQNKQNLMNELSKIYRVLKKHGDEIPQETILVLDATVGQNAHNQVEYFNKYSPLTGLIVTKLDGTAKGGVIISLARKHNLPIVSIGIGESINDLHHFSAKEFSKAILGN